MLTAALETCSSTLRFYLGPTSCEPSHRRDPGSLAAMFCKTSRLCAGRRMAEAIGKWRPGRA